MPRLRPVSEQFKITRQGTLQQVHDRIVTVAKTEHAKIMQTDPRPSSFVRKVDGRVGVAEEAVKSNGVIIYTYQRLDEVVAFALETLQRLSPVLTGAYAKSHTLFVNGEPTDQPTGLKADHDIAISNPEPYSRKIEIGSMKMRVSGTDHVYEQAAQIVNARFGNLVKVRFTYRGLVGGLAVKGRAGNKSANRYPALTFSVR